MLSTAMSRPDERAMHTEFVMPGQVTDHFGKAVLTGDVDFDGVKMLARSITPVPGGVGPMTRVSLLRNTLLAVRQKEI